MGKANKKENRRVDTLQAGQGIVTKAEPTISFIGVRPSFEEGYYLIAYYLIRSFLFQIGVCRSQW